MSIEIREFRLAFIWTRIVLADPPATLAGPGAGRAAYERLVAALGQNGPVDGFEFPWRRDKPYAHRVWVKYLEDNNPGQVTVAKAWARGVPLRAEAPPLTISPPAYLAGWPRADKAGMIRAESFIYPFGPALIVSVTVRGALSEESWLELSRGLATQKLRGTFQDGQSFDAPLAAIAANSLNASSLLYFGSTQADFGSGDPFRVMAVVRAEGAPADKAPDDPVRRVIQGGATLLPNWSTAGVDHFSERSIGIRGAASPGDVVYALNNARVIWSPSAFGSPEGPRNSIGCYYRNQVLASLQTQALCGLAAAMHQRIRVSRDQPARLDDLGRIPVDVLPGLYLGGKTTYRSRSIQTLIEDSDVADAMTALIKRYGGPGWPPKKKDP